MSSEQGNSSPEEVQVSVIVVNWNGKGLLQECLDSVKKQKNISCEIIVVDNGSTDGSVEYLSGRGDLLLLQNDTNRGFAAGNNQGIEKAKGQWVLLLNNDARLEVNALSHLLAAVKNESQAGSASPKILRVDGKRIDSTGIVLQKWKMSPRDRGEEEQDLGQWDEPEYRNIFGPTGAAAFYRKKALEDVQVFGEVFDEDFFAYYEDVDLAWRLRLFGWDSLYVPQAIVLHDRQGPGKKSSELKRRAYVNRLWCFYKNEIPALLPTYLVYASVWETVRFFKLAIKNPSMFMCCRLLKKEWGLMKRKRKEIQSRKRRDAGDMRIFF